MFGSILNRTIFLELTKVFVMSLIGITGMLLLAGVISEASKEGLAPQQILAIIPLIIPSTLPYTIPATTLFASCVIYGRLAADNEMLAIKAAGVNVMRIIVPGLLLGLATSGATFGLYYGLIPATRFYMRTVFLNDVENLLYAVLEKDGSFQHPKLDYEIDVAKVQGRKLLNAEFMHRDATRAHFDIIARAKEAELFWDAANKKILVHMRFCTIWSDKSDRVYVEDKVYPVDLPDELSSTTKYRPSDMTWDELFQARRNVLGKIGEREAEIANQVARLATSNPPTDLPQHIRNLRAATKHLQQEIRDIDVERQKRPSLALGCLCFVLVGCPVGIWFGRSDYLSAFVTCFLPIVLLYYPLLLCGLNLSRSGQAYMLTAIWVANVLVGLIALGLYRRLLRN